jgi:hypothetical protein
MQIFFSRVDLNFTLMIELIELTCDQVCQWWGTNWIPAVE